jgi:membrane-associated phospholipid phosphatase
MKQLYKINRIFFVLYLIFLISAGVILLIYSKTQIHLFINEYHSKAGNIFFKLFTNAGNGLVPVLLGLFLLIFSVRKALILGISAAIAGLLAQLFKNFIFPSEVRPKVYFDKIAELYFIPGVEVHSWHSFPSGHTASAFCLFFVLAGFTSKIWLKIIYFFAAILVGYSRIYLSQHFLIDVYFGSVIGLFSAIIIILLMNRSNKPWMDKSIGSILSKPYEKRD